MEILIVGGIAVVVLGVYHLWCDVCGKETEQVETPNRYTADTKKKTDFLCKECHVRKTHKF